MYTEFRVMQFFAWTQMLVKWEMYLSFETLKKYLIIFSSLIEEWLAFIYPSSVDFFYGFDHVDCQIGMHEFEVHLLVCESEM